MKLICVFVFAYAKSRFSHDAAHLVFLRIPATCICKKKSAAQLRSNCFADQHLCFSDIDSKIPLLPTSKISSL